MKYFVKLPVKTTVTFAIEAESKEEALRKLRAAVRRSKY